MDKYENRRRRLIELRDTFCNGSPTELARKIGREPSYISRMLYPEGKRWKKRIAEDMAEIVEQSFGLPRGWMDGHDAPSPEAPPPVQKLPDDPYVVRVTAIMRQLCPEQKGRILGYAESVAAASEASSKANAVA